MHAKHQEGTHAKFEQSNFDGISFVQLRGQLATGWAICLFWAAQQALLHRITMQQLQVVVELGIGRHIAERELRPRCLDNTRPAARGLVTCIAGMVGAQKPALHAYPVAHPARHDD
jgi:hypothetical protein